MHELSKKEYNKVSSLFEDLKVDRLAASKVIKAHHPRRIYVDRKEKPTAALISAGSCYLGGDAKCTDSNEKLKNLLETEILRAREVQACRLYL